MVLGSGDEDDHCDDSALDVSVSESPARAAAVWGVFSELAVVSELSSK